MTGSRTRTRVVVDQTELARQIGARLRTARLSAGLTQQQLASPRYTKAYVSALENGLSRPSMGALTFFAERLGLPAERFIGNAPAVWSRLDADLALASRRWEAAAPAYETLLATATGPAQRAELLLGRAEALAGLDAGPEAAAAAREAAQLFEGLGRKDMIVPARYWLAWGEYQQGNFAEARAQFEWVLGQVRSGTRPDPDFELRVVMALARTAARVGEDAIAVSYLEEIDALDERLDDHARATYYNSLACAHREAGDFEAAIRSGVAAIALYHAAESDLEMGALEDDLAASYLALGDAAKAAELADDSHLRFERLGDDKYLAKVLDTQARIALARRQHEEGKRLAREALTLAERTSNALAQIDALVTLARAEIAAGQTDAANELYERAAEATRKAAARGRMREVLAEWAELLAKTGEHQRAFELMREAVRDQ